MTEKRRLNLSFSMASPQQREAWRILRAIPSGRRTEAVCRAVCQADLADTIRTIIREELQSIHIEKENNTGTQAGDVDDNVLGFLLALQNDGGDE